MLATPIRYYYSCMSYTAGYGSNVTFNDRQWDSRWDFENIFVAKSLRLSHLEGLYAVEQ